MLKERRSWCRIVAWATFAGAVVLALGGFGVHPGSASDPHSSFRCPPAIVSAWGGTALERSPTEAPTDTEVDVRCATPAQRRVGLAVLAVGVSAVLGSAEVRRRGP